MTEKQRLTILGSTGSIGASTLDVIARHPDRYEVVALTARDRVHVLFQQCLRFRPRTAVVLDEAGARTLRERLSGAGLDGCEVRCGPEALEEAASRPDVHTVMAAIVGIA